MKNALAFFRAVFPPRAWVAGWQGSLRRGLVLRVLVDFVIVNISLLAAIALRTMLFAYQTGETTALDFTNAIVGAVQSLWGTSLVLTPVSLVIFYFSGFYTHGRAYRGRYKVLMILQAVTLAYVIQGLLSYLRLVPAIARGAWLTGWIFTLGLAGGARLFSLIWSDVVRSEDRLLRQASDSHVRRVLVIGGAGYVGSSLVRQLLQREYRVRVLDLLLYGDRGMAKLRSHPRFEFTYGDFRNIEAVVRCMSDVDAVVHLGAIVGDPASDIDPAVTLDVNVTATRLIAEVARGYGVRRFVFASTCSVYGASDELLDEKSALNPVSIYAQSKVASEDLLLKLTDDQFSPVVLRFATLFGLSYRPRFDIVLNLLTAKAVLEKRIVIIDGDQWRPFLHVEDAAAAVIRCLEVPATLIVGQIFNVGSTDLNYRLRDIVQMIMEEVPGTEVIYVENEGPRRNYRVSCQKIQQRLGFQVSRGVRDGVREIRRVIELGEIKDYSSSEYSNFNFLAEAGIRMTRLSDGGAKAVENPN